MDPWLLRHCRYDEYGLCRLYGTHLRNVGGVPVQGLVPVHFMLADNQNSSSDQGGDARYAKRLKLNQLVLPSHGELLLSLFLTFVFPMMPVISRSQLEQQGLDYEMPVILLTAIYASALPFVAHDPVLFVSGAYNRALSSELWDMVFRGIQEETHTPGLATIQASILYLQRLPAHNQQVLNDTPSRSSFHGSTVGVAMSLGLHLEPRPWGIPAWEKRLRRRLWWAIYLEDKWTSLLLGRPPLIREEEWDVFDLDDLDFELDDPMASNRRFPSIERSSRGIIFQHFIKLARLVETIHHTFYTLKTSQKLCEDFRASIDAARPIREGLQAWYSKLPDDLHLKPRLEGTQSYEHRQGVAALHISYLTLEVFLYRAILRPLAKSPPPPPIFPEGSNISNLWGTVSDLEPSVSSWLLDDLVIDNLEDSDQQNTGMEFSKFGEAAEVTLNAAEKCAGIIVKFVANLVSKDFDVLWYSWIRICFPTVTSFITLLFVQAPTVRHAAKSKELLNGWSLSLRSQHRSHEGLMTLGLMRLHSLHTVDLAQVFMLSPSAVEVLRGVNMEDTE